jgi:PAS domain S-box-containing protein
MASGLLAMATAIVVLVGWIVDSPALKGAVFGGLTTKANAAVGLWLAGASLCLLTGARVSTMRRRTGEAGALLALILGALTSVEYALGVDLGIDQLLFAERPGWAATSHPNRMGPPAAVCLILLGIALLLLRSRRRRLVELSQHSTFAAALAAVIPTLAYVYGVRPFYLLGYTDTALPMAAGLMVLSVGVLVSRPELGIMRLVSGEDPGGLLLRRTLPVTVGVAAVCGWLTLRANRAGMIDEGLATGLLVVAFIAMSALFLVASAVAVRRETQAVHDAVEAYRDVSRQLTLAVSAGRLGTFDWDVRRDVAVWSDELLALYGLRRHEFGGRYQDWLACVVEEDRDRFTAGLRPPQDRSDVEIEFRIRRRDTGEIHWMHCRAQVFPDAAGATARMVGINMDITERKATEEDLARAKAAAEEASRSKDHFLAVLSHELRTPLTPVLTALSLLQRHQELPEAARGYLAVIRRNVELESRLIDDLLDVSRIERGKVELDRRPVPLCEIIERAVEVCRADIDARRLHFGVDLGPRPYIVEADSARLQQVLWNLLKNAVKFTPPGGCVGVRCWPEHGQVVLQVQDSGIGIDPAASERIFEAFNQGERSITREFGGLGLGLAIAKALVEMHGGTVEASSQGLHQGATFTVRLPLLAWGPGATTGTRAPASRAARRAGRPGRRVLLVEDHGDAVTTLVDILELHGHRVETAGDVDTALEIAERQTFDVLVSDLGLPDRSGLDLVRALRARGHRMPAIAISGYGQERDIEHSRSAGFTAHLVKPFDPDRLLREIDRLAEVAPEA